MPPHREQETIGNRLLPDHQPAALEEVACECYQNVRQEFDRLFS